MCGQSYDDPSMHAAKANVCMECGEPANTRPYSMAGTMHKWGPLDHDFVSSIHNHPDHERFVIGCPPCEYGAIQAEAQDQRRHQNY